MERIFARLEPTTHGTRLAGYSDRDPIQRAYRYALNNHEPFGDLSRATAPPDDLLAECERLLTFQREWWWEHFGEDIQDHQIGLADILVVSDAHFDRWIATRPDTKAAFDPLIRKVLLRPVDRATLIHAVGHESVHALEGATVRISQPVVDFAFDLVSCGYLSYASKAFLFLEEALIETTNLLILGEAQKHSIAREEISAEIAYGPAVAFLLNLLTGAAKDLATSRYTLLLDLIHHLRDGNARAWSFLDRAFGRGILARLARVPEDVNVANLAGSLGV